MSQESLHCLKRAVDLYCPDCEFVIGQETYRTWATDHDGETEMLPKGWKQSELGHNAAHAIRMTDAALQRSHKSRDSVYEIGVVPVRVTRNKEGRVLEAIPDRNANEFVLISDYFLDGKGILRCAGIGRHGPVTNPLTGEVTQMAFAELYQNFRVEELKYEAEMQGDSVSVETREDGSVVITANTEARLGVA